MSRNNTKEKINAAATVKKTRAVTEHLPEYNAQNDNMRMQYPQNTASQKDRRGAERFGDFA